MWLGVPTWLSPSLEAGVGTRGYKEDELPRAPVTNVGLALVNPNLPDSVYSSLSLKRFWWGKCCFKNMLAPRDGCLA